ncbi:hypothetical protein [Psychromicrobium sp. YIM B11713]|uniref:hypothetical protein n=1 Tax=Psychromicrobium sp. YIM B11713 TaxID=3145233 RepID=UPI00374F77CA
MRLSFTASRRLLSLSCALVSVLGLTVAAALPVQASSDASNWSELGQVSTDSAVTVRWDNRNNAANATVPRDQTQQILHTKGKNYLDIAPLINNKYASQFGADNGQGGLQLTVSQTESLVNQAIQLTVSGGPKSLSGNAANNPYLQIFQCWGAPGSDGKPDPRATSPDPATCQLGTAGIGSAGDPGIGSRVPLRDPLLSGGDWAEYEAKTAVPVLGIDGSSTPGDAPHNTFFSSTTTNEIDRLYFDSEGKAQTVFETQTGAEANFMGCGLARGPSTSNCWLVAVPRTPEININNYPEAWGSALSPSLWAQRLQVKLGFRNAPGACSGSEARSLSAGSELLDSAMDSWIPALCSSQKLATGYTKLSDAQARRQQAEGNQPMVLTSEPSPGSWHAPIALSGIVLAFNIGMNDAQGNYLGPVPELKLNARLVAKLLTQSYQAGMGLDANSDGGKEFASKVPWAQNYPASIVSDPEFIKLNPGLSSKIDKGSFTGGNIQLESLRSDAADRLWEWLVADPDAGAFLNGCPDENGQVINPFYSTRSYQGCQAQATALESTAKLRRQQTVKPSTYADIPASYPPDSASYPLPGWYESVPIVRDANGPIPGPDGKPQIDQNKLSLTMPDVYPRQDSMSVTGKNAFRAITPSNKEWCGKVGGCVAPDFPAVGKWISTTSTPADLPYRFSLSITDAATAARYQLPTAKLCNTQGDACVGASSSSLLKETARLQKADGDGVQKVAVSADYAAGAYPLALPVYAAVKPAGLLAKDAKAFASMLDYVSTKGQASGTAPGQLPPGYAPLTASLQAQTAAVVSKLRSITDPAAQLPPPGGKPAAGNPADSGSGKSDTGNAPGPAADAPSAPTDGGKVKDAPGNAAAPGSEDLSQAGSTQGAANSFLQYALIIALGIGLLAGLASPLLSRIGRAQKNKRG